MADGSEFFQTCEEHKNKKKNKQILKDKHTQRCIFTKLNSTKIR